MKKDNPVESLHYLPGKKRFIFQRNDIFSFSIDAVLLAKFARIPKHRGKIIDLCTGSGAIPLLMSLRSSAQVHAVEIQNLLCELAEKSISYNHLEDQIKVINKSILDLEQVVTRKSYDVVTCNPPYFPVTKEGEKNTNQKVSFARHEISCTLDDVVRISGELVKPMGRVVLVHRPERLSEIFITMNKYHLEPKHVQFVHPRKGRDANMVLIEGVHGGKPGIKTSPPIFVYGDGQQYTKEFKEYYETW